MNIPRPLVVGLMIVVPAVLRMLQVDWNLIPIGALALFCGAHFRNRALAVTIPLAAMFLGDLLLGIKHSDLSFYTFHSLIPVVYGCYVVSALMGMGLRRYWDNIEAQDRRKGPEERRSRSVMTTRVIPIALTTLTGSVLFFVVSNMGVWYVFDTYPKTLAGLVYCYEAAIPFFRGTLTGDVVGAAVLFGGDYLLQLNAAAAAESKRI